MLIVLSSGFLAFARHIGVVQACAREGVRPSRISGVSSGALIGALWAAGESVEAMLDLVRASAPVRSMAPRFPWAAPGFGLFSLDRLHRRLAARLPARIEDLPVPFTAGVVRRADNACVLVERGPLAEAVVASCAMPWIFGPRLVEGQACVDGGAEDRIFLRPLLERHACARTLVHLVAGSSPGHRRREQAALAQLAWAAERTQLHVVRTPPSGASFLSLGDIDAQVALAARCAEPEVRRLNTPPATGY